MSSDEKKLQLLILSTKSRRSTKEGFGLQVVVEWSKLHLSKLEVYRLRQFVLGYGWLINCSSLEENECIDTAIAAFGGA